LEKVNKAIVNAELSIIKGQLKTDKNNSQLLDIKQVFERYLALLLKESETKKAIKEKEAALDAELLAFYPTLNSEQIKQLVVDDKWMVAIAAAIHSEMNRVSQQLTQRITELAERYATPLPEISANVANLSAKVAAHLKNMGVRYE
jgi:type I restriction enzyme M protein